MQARAIALFALTFATLGPHIASARVHEGLTLSGATRKAKVIAVVTIVGRTRTATQPRRVALRVRARVEVPLKGTRFGRVLSFAHWAARTGIGPQINGYSYAKLVPGETMMLFLRARGQTLSLVGAEVQPPRYSRAICPSVRRSLVKMKSSPRARVVFALRAQLERCRRRCPRAIWMLGEGQKAGKVPRAWLAKRLRAIAKASRHGNTRLAAYTVLGRLRVKAVVADIVRFIGGRAANESARSNAISWLQGFDNATQRRALQRILKMPGATKGVRRTIAYRLRYLK